MIYYLPKTTTYYFQGKVPTSPLPPEVKLIAWFVGITTWTCFYVYYITTR